MQGPNGLYVPKVEKWCDTRICGQLNSGNSSATCKMDLCHFNSSYGQEENIEGVVLRDNAVLCNSSVPVNDTNYRLLNLAFGYRMDTSQSLQPFHVFKLLVLNFPVYTLLQCADVIFHVIY